MKILMIKASALSALDSKNNGESKAQRLQPALLKTGEPFLNADLLNDCGPGQTWERYANLIASAEARDVSHRDLRKGPQFTRVGVQSEEEFDLAVAQVEIAVTVKEAA